MIVDQASELAICWLQLKISWLTPFRVVKSGAYLTRGQGVVCTARSIGALAGEHGDVPADRASRPVPDRPSITVASTRSGSGQLIVLRLTSTSGSASLFGGWGGAAPCRCGGR